MNIKTSKGFVEKVEFYSDIASLVNRPATLNDIKSEYFPCTFWLFSSISLVVFLRGGVVHRKFPFVICEQFIQKFEMKLFKFCTSQVAYTCLRLFSVCIANILSYIKSVWYRFMHELELNYNVRCECLINVEVIVRYAFICI